MTRSCQISVLEALENRQLLSTNVGLAQLPPAVAAIALPAVAATRSIIGIWTGIATDASTQGQAPVVVDITKQNRRGVLAGTGSVAGYGGTCTGKISGNSVTLKCVGNLYGTVTKVNAAYSVRRHVKTLSGTWSSGANSGTIVLKFA